MAYETAGDVLNNRHDELYEEAEELKNELGTNFRVIEDYNANKPLIEREVETGDRWVAVAEIDHPNAAYEWADELADEVDGETYRVVFDYTNDNYHIEARVTDEN